MTADTDPPEAGAPATAGQLLRSRPVQVVLASTALAPLGVPLISPTLPAFRDAFGVGDAQASLLVAGYFVAGIVLSPFIGLLADRVGRKRVLVSGLLVFGSLGAAIALAPTFEVAMALRVVQGTGAAAIFITTVTIISETFEGPERRAVLGYNVAVLSATAALFPVVGGLLVTVAWNAPFVAYLAALPAALFAALALEEPTRPAADRGIAYLREALRTVARPAILGLFAVTFLTEFLAFGVVFTAVPFLLEDVLSPPLVGAVILATEATSTVVAASSGRLTRVLSTERFLALGMACYGVGFGAAWLATGPVFLAGGLVVAGGGIGLLLPSIDAALSDRIAAEYRAGAFSLRNSTTFLGRTSGPVVFAAFAVTRGLGYETLLLAASAVALAAAALVTLATR